MLFRSYSKIETWHFEYNPDNDINIITPIIIVQKTPQQINKETSTQQTIASESQLKTNLIRSCFST